MFQTKRSTPNHAPFTVQDMFANRTAQNPTQFLTICSLSIPKLKQPSLLLADDTVSMDQESTCFTSSLKMSRENVENNKTELCSDQNIQSSSLFALNDSLYHLPSQRITPIASISEIDEENENEGSSLTKEIKISLKTVRSKNDIMSPKASNTAESNCSTTRKNAPLSSSRAMKRPYTGAPSMQNKRPITGKPDLEYHFSSRKINISLCPKLNETNKIWIPEISSPATARESSDIWTNPEGPAVHNIVFEPPREESPKAVGVRAKLKACVGAEVPQTPLKIKFANEQSVQKGDKTPKTAKTSVAWTLKCHSAALLPNPSSKIHVKVKAGPLRIMTSESKSRLRTVQVS